jgi:hypothetical protein
VVGSEEEFDNIARGGRRRFLDIEIGREGWGFGGKYELSGYRKDGVRSFCVENLVICRDDGMEIGATLPL